MERITDIGKLTELRIPVPPGLMINGNVVSSRIVPEKFIIESWIREALNNIESKPNKKE